MVQTRLAALHVPSVLQELRHRRENHHAKTAAAIAVEARAVTVPYPVGLATLQITGIHLRLTDIKEAAAVAAASAKLHATTVSSSAASPPGSADTNTRGGFQFFGGARKTSSATTTASSTEAAKPATDVEEGASHPSKKKKTVTEEVDTKTASSPQGPPLAVNVVIRVQVQPAGAATGIADEAADHTREFIAAIVPLQLGGNVAVERPSAPGTASSSSPQPTRGGTEKPTGFPAPFLAKKKKGPRPAKGAQTAAETPVGGAGVATRLALEAAPVSASTFVKLDLRLQVERVRLVVEVLPGLASPSQAGAAESNSPYRRRPREETAQAAPASTDAVLDVVVVGTVSPLV